MASQPPAIVFSSMVTGLGVIRSLGQAGVPVIALDPNPLAPGLHSRYVTKSRVCPDPLRSEIAFVDFLVKLGQELEQKGVLFPTSDTYVPVLAKARKKLEPLFYLPQYDERNLSILTDKRQQYREVERLGIPVPRTYLPESVTEVRALSTKLRYPMVLKPAHSRPFFIHYGIKAWLVYTPNQLVRKYEEYHRAGHPMVVQEFIPGGPQNLYFLQTCTDDDARPMFYFVGRKVVQEPSVFGTAVAIQQVDQGEVADLSGQAMEALGFRQYIGHTEFKYDPVSGEWKFLELNPRPPISVMLPTASGVNLPFMAYQQMSGRPVSTPSLERPGLSWVMELTTPSAYRNVVAMLLAHWRLYFGPITYAFFSTDDLKPFFYALMVGLQELKNKLALGRMSG